MSPNPEKLLIVDGHTPPAETEPYLDYYVKQNYGSSSVSFTSTFPYEKQVFTENIGAYWQTGGGMEAQAAAKAPEGHFKGGFGAFFCLRDYHTSDSGADKEIPYGHLRRAIQLQNPAVTNNLKQNLNHEKYHEIHTRGRSGVLVAHGVSGVRRLRKDHRRHSGTGLRPDRHGKPLHDPGRTQAHRARPANSSPNSPSAATPRAMRASRRPSSTTLRWSRATMPSIKTSYAALPPST